jgi:hypothetical protein
MEYIYQADFTDFPTSLDQVEAAKIDRDCYAEVTLGLAAPIKYTRAVFEYFDPYTYNVWENLDRTYCLKAAEWHCRTAMSNKHTQHTILVGNGGVMYCREAEPSAAELNDMYNTFMEWNGSKAPASIGGFPFRIYMMKYVPDESSSESESTFAGASAPAEEEESDAKPTIELDDISIPPPPQNSPVLRRSERLAKKKVRRSKRIADQTPVDYSDMM